MSFNSTRDALAHNLGGRFFCGWVMLGAGAHMTFVWPHFFGRAHLGSIQGSATTINVVGASLGPFPLGMAYDSVASYGGALLLLAILPICCAVAVLFSCAVAVLFSRAPDLDTATAQ